MSRANQSRRRPRAMIHRRILDVADANPEASLDDIAAEVSAASPSLVGRVLDEYGDPAGGDTAGDADPDPAPDPNGGKGTDDSVSDGWAAATESPHGDTASDADPDPDPDEGGVAPSEDAAETNERATAETDSQGDGTPTQTTDGGAPAASADDADDTQPMNANTDAHASANGHAVTDGQTPTNDDATDDGAETTESAADAAVDASDLSDRQRETLRVVHEHPDHSQRDVAERLGVTRPTVSRRLNAIPGFEWEERGAFAASVFGAETGGEPADAELVADGTGTGTGAEARTGTGDGVTVEFTPDLAHTVLSACLESERVSDEEERELVRALMGA